MTHVDEPSASPDEYVLNVPTSASSLFIDDIGACYDVLGIIGKGGTAAIYAACSRTNQEKHALKVMDKFDARKAKILKFVLTEIRILRMLDHPNTIKCHSIYETKDDFIISMELLEGLDLFQAIQAQGHRFAEIRATAIIRDVLHAVEYLHSIGCVHRDINPCNIMFADRDHTTVKLIDFGFSAMLLDQADQAAAIMEEQCGTVAYMAPEVIQSAMSPEAGYGLACDMWSVGCVLYCVLSATEAFYQDPPEVLYKIISTKYDFVEEVWTFVSNDAIELIGSLLVDQSVRLTATQALGHPWLSGLDSKDGLQLSTASRGMFTVDPDSMYTSYTDIDHESEEHGES